LLPPALKLFGKVSTSLALNSCGVFEMTAENVLKMPKGVYELYFSLTTFVHNVSNMV